MSKQEPPVYMYPPALMDAPEAARYLGISTRNVYEQAARGVIPAPIALGCRKLWRKTDLDEWIAVQPAAQTA